MLDIEFVAGIYDTAFLSRLLVRRLWGENARAWHYSGLEPQGYAEGFVLKRPSVSQARMCLDEYVDAAIRMRQGNWHPNVGFDKFYIGLGKNTDMSGLWELQDALKQTNASGLGQYLTFQLSRPTYIPTEGNTPSLGVDINRDELERYAYHRARPSPEAVVLGATH